MKQKIFFSLSVVAVLFLAVISIAGDDPPPAPAAPAEYAIPWQSVNAGGAPAQSTNYQLNGSAGQSAIGYATSTSYQHGAGYWYGIPGGEACYCGNWGDVSNDNQVNPVDVVRMVNYVYKGQTGAFCADPCGP